MYRPIDKLQHSFLDFNQPMGLKMNPENRWIKMADLIILKKQFDNTFYACYTTFKADASSIYNISPKYYISIK
ncbi:MAG: hypothetical protein IJ733_02755 [Lachnospiraceae bacterium]|nr:hypothetical protein [Lachnospiraceae bacterium]